jgi:hypothetical protein
MNPEDTIPEGPPAPKPIEYKYLHGDVHPVPPNEKPGHEHKLGESTLFPKSTPVSHPEDDLGMYM